MKPVSRRDFLRKLAFLCGMGAGVGASAISCASKTEPAGGASIPTGLATARPAQPTAPSPASPTTGAAPLAPATSGFTPITSTAPAATAAATPTPTPSPSTAYLAVARGESPTAMVQATLEALGGIERFVKPGNEVIVKPNICVAYHTYEYAATTNPEVVAALVKLCLGAGAKRVRVMDSPFGGTAEQAYARSGIADAVKAAGGQMELMSNLKYQDTAIPNGRDITRWKVYRDALEADVLIDVPIAKTHNLAGLTLGMKNLLGVIQNREGIHANLGQRVADIASLVRPTLTVVDAVRILMRNGPTGGRLDDVKLANTIVASHDIVAADAYAATLFGRTGADIPAIVAGAKMGLGTMDLKSVKVEEIAV